MSRGSLPHFDPRQEYQFPGLQPGDRWRLCVERWHQVLRAGCAPPVVLDACHVSALEFVSLEEVQARAASPTRPGTFAKKGLIPAKIEVVAGLASRESLGDDTARCR